METSRRPGPPPPRSALLREALAPRMFLPPDRTEMTAFFVMADTALARTPSDALLRVALETYHLYRAHNDPRIKKFYQAQAHRLHAECFRRARQARL